MAECSEISSDAMWAAMKAYKTAVSTVDRMVGSTELPLVLSMVGK